MSSPKDEKPVPPKVIVRRRPPGALPPPAPAPGEDPWDRFEPQDNYDDSRPKTGHDLYLTYDIKGKLRTHTVYHNPVDPKTIVPRPGKKKKKTESPESPQNPEPSNQTP